MIQIINTILCPDSILCQHYRLGIMYFQPDPDRMPIEVRGLGNLIPGRCYEITGGALSG